jgi:hypothetical protein
MSFLKKLLNPASIVGELSAILSVAVAFGAPITQAQSNSILVFGGAIALIFVAHGLTGALSYITPQTVYGLVTAAIGVAIAFGLQLTAAQQSEILNLTGVLAGLLLVHGAVHTLARDRLTPAVALDSQLVTMIEALIRKVVQEVIATVKLAPAAAGDGQCAETPPTLPSAS